MRIPFRLAGVGDSKENRKLLGNTAYLYVIQGVNYLLPIITIPYLIRVMGTETFGFIAFAGSLMTYFQIVVDYGFNLSATRDVSLHRTDVKWLSQHFFSVLSVKFCLAMACLAVFIPLLLGIPRFHNEASFYSWLYMGVVGSILFPVWFFQGVEAMGYITLFNLLSRLATTVLYFLLIKSSRDYMWFVYLGTAGTWAIGIASGVVVMAKFKIHPVFPKYVFCKECVQGGFQMFITQLSVSLYTNTNTFLLGLFAGDRIVGIYAVAEKIIRAAISLTGPLGSAIFPRITLLFNESRERAIRFLKKTLAFGTLVFGFLSVVLFVCADILVLLISGHQSKEIATLVRIMSFLPLIVFIDNILGTQIMLNNKMQKHLMWIIIIGGVISVSLQLILVPLIYATGTALAFLSSEMVIVVSMVIVLRRAGIRLFRKTAN
jgi:PST family polysaccharide transporter